jgi:hypothetical protein
MVEVGGLGHSFYIGLAYALTWGSFAVYWFRLRARRHAALRTLAERGGES